MNKKLTLFAAALCAAASSAFAWNTPSIASPATGSNGWVGQTFDWNAVTSSVAYQIEIDTLPAFTSPVRQRVTKAYINSSSGNTDTQHNFSNLYFGKTYYWHVRAYIANDTSAWSTTYTFLTRDYVTMVSPATASQTWTGVTLDWNAHTGVAYYDMQCDTSPLFTSPALRSSTDAYINSSSGNTDTDEFLAGLYFGKTYYWRVRARNSVDTSLWSTPWTFSTADYVTIVSPVNFALAWTGVTLDWNAHTGVSYYDMQCDTNINFTSPALRSSTDAYINSSSGNTDTDEFLSSLYFGQRYYWRVRARNSVDTSAWSTLGSFITRDYVTPVSPTANATTWTGLTFDWNAHTGVSFYDMQCDTNINFSSPALRAHTDAYINSSSGNTDTDEFINNLYFGQRYYWRVRARNAVDTSVWSTPILFTTADYVTLSSPANAQLNVNPSGVTLDWNAHTGVSTYQLQWDSINLYNSPVFQQVNKTYINSSSGNSDTQNGSGALATNRVYFWRVRAINAVDTSEWTERWFSTGTAVPTIPGTPVLVSPANMAVSQPTSITLTWNPSLNAQSYEYQYAQNASFTNATSGNTAGTSVSLNLPQSTLYYWRVRAVNGNVVSAWSAAWRFTTIGPLAVPLLVSPADLSTGISTNSVTLDWDFVANANQYEYQYTTDNTFMTGVVSAIVTATFENVGPLLPQTTYYWRVRATDGVTYSGWSTVWSFTTQMNLAAPALISPANLTTGILVGGTQLDWGSVANAVDYEYELSTNSSFTANVASGTTASLSFVTGALNANTTYYWHVRAVNGNVVSAWSPVWSCETELQLAAPSLVSPANLSTGISVSGVLLDWATVANAATYDYEYSTTANFSANVVSGSISNSDVATATLNTLTTYYWRVRAVNGAVVSPWSQVWEFTTDNPLNVAAANAPTVTVFPNPAHEQFTVSGTQAGDVITIIDATGKTIQTTTTLNTTTVIDVRGLAPGIYILQVMGAPAITKPVVVCE